MARIHILQQEQPNIYRAVVHEATPAGNNSAGIPWSTAIKNSGTASTVMEVGSGAGQISTSESNAVIAGTILEGVFQVQIDPAWTATERNAALDAAAGLCLSELQARLAFSLKWYGATRA